MDGEPSGGEITGVEMVENERIDWLDCMKGVLIFLVVLGHTFGAARNVTMGHISKLMLCGYKSIYLFHMPAFFFIAGMTLKSFDFTKKFKRLLIPYFCFGVISVIVYQVAMRGDGMIWWHPWASLIYGAAFPGTDGFRCNSVLWFLPCLFVTTWAAYWIFRVLDSMNYGKWIEFMLAMASLLAYVYMNRAWYATRSWWYMYLPFGINEAFRFLPFVVAGHLIPKKFYAWKFLWMLPLCYVALCPITPYNRGIYFDYGKWMLVTLTGFLGIAACMWLSKTIQWRVIVHLGGLSIGVMMIHKWFVIAFFKLGWIEPVSTCVVATVISYYCATYIRRWCPTILGEDK